MQDYRDYLWTPHWRGLRQEMLKAAKHRCQQCGRERKRGLYLHHRNYERLGKELPEDLIVLCKECHRAWHDCAKNMGV